MVKRVMRSSDFRFRKERAHRFGSAFRMVVFDQ
jgi:hypothetical protein